jgi:putative ABC transport system ATP-binding protein
MGLIKVDKVSFSYDDIKYVLKNISMDFESSKIYSIVGRSGAGKTTLISLIAGLEVTKEGTIYYKDQDLSKIDRNKYRSREIGVVFQQFNLLYHLTALENVMLSMNISGMKAANKKKKALQLLKKVGLDEAKANRKILNLSGGEQQRVSIARALSYDAEVILADEPTGNLDRETEDDIIELLLKLAHEDNKCVIIVSHSARVQKKADVIYYLVNGKLSDQKEDD